MPTQSFTLEEWIRPLWEGDVAAHETVLFRENERVKRLTFPADGILEVRSADLETVYEEGRDWRLEDGCLTRSEGSRLPVMPLDLFYPPEDPKGVHFRCAEEGHPILGNGIEIGMVAHMTDVTYRHRAAWQGPTVAPQTDKCARLLARLARGEEATVVFYGDSITTGADSSGVHGIPPFTPPFPELTASALARKYGYALSLAVKPYQPLKPVLRTGGGTLHYVNTSVGGMESAWALANVGERVSAYSPDLVVLAFGMNDGGKTAEHYMDLTRRIVGEIRKNTPGADVLLVSTMLPHWRAAGFFGHQNEYEDALAQFAKPLCGVGLAPMTSVHRWLLTRKEFYDMSGNNVNHPSDFLARVYAMVLLAALDCRIG